MAEPQEPKGNPFEPQPEDETDVLFKAQMWAYDKLMAHWKHGLYVAGAVLLVALGYDLYSGWARGVAEEGSRRIAEVDRRMPQPDQLAQLGLAPLDDLEDPARVEALRTGATRYEEAARASGGPTAAEAWIKAADAWLRLDDKAAAEAAFRAAIDEHGRDVVGFAARSGLAALLEDGGDAAGALAVLREQADQDKGFLGEHCLLRMAELQERTAQHDAALATVRELQGRYPDSVRVRQLAERLGAPPPPQPAPPAEG